MRYFEKGRSLLRKALGVKYRFIDYHNDRFPVCTMCNLLDVSRNGYYECRFLPLSNCAIEDRRLMPLIRVFYAAGRGVYGYRRVLLDLWESGEIRGKHRVRRIMKFNGIRPLHGDKVPRAIQGRPSIITPNKLKCAFAVVQPDYTRVTDITYIRIWQGWLYLAVVLDLIRAGLSGGR